MDLTNTFKTDYVSWDNTESVVYESARRPVDSPALARELRNPNVLDVISIAKRRALSSREIQASLGAYTGGDRVWLLPVAVFPTSIVPKVSDVVVDADGTRWTALEVQLNKFGQTHRLTCRALSIAFALRDKADIERPYTNYDEAGAAIKHFPTGPGPRGGTVAYQGLVCRVQLMTEQIADERGIRGFKGAYAIIVEREVVVTNEDRIRLTQDSTDGLPAGTYLEVRDYHQAQTIDNLAVIAAEKAV